MAGWEEAAMQRGGRPLLAVVLTLAAIPGVVTAETPAPLPPAPDLEQPLDPGRDGWGPYGAPSPEPGFSLGAELGVVHPVVRNRITNEVPVSPTGDVLTLPSATLLCTVSPDFEVAYRLPRSLGYFAVDYRFVIAEGSATDELAGAAADLHSRLTEHVIDIDYGSSPVAFAARWEFDWRVGARIADVFFDSTLRNDLMFQQASNNFLGAGPHVRLDLQRHLLCPPGFSLYGFSLYGRLEGAVAFGRISQKFREEIGDLSGFQEQNSFQSVPTLLLQAGVRWVPRMLPSTTWTLGYVYEHWWYVGQLGTDSSGSEAQSASRGEVETQGIFLRGEIDF
jgi:hypothetical protein